MRDVLNLVNFRSRQRPPDVFLTQPDNRYSDACIGEGLHPHRLSFKLTFGSSCFLLTAVTTGN